MFETDRQPDHSITNTSRLALVRGKLAVCGRGGMNNQRPGIADIGQMREQITAFNKRLSRRKTAGQGCGKDRPRPARRHGVPRLEMSAVS